MMSKSITPVVSVILLIMLTIVASVGAYFFINSEVTSLESSGAIENSPYTDNSRLNMVSITGSQALVRNDGSSPVTEIVVLINGELLNYTLDTPIQPGEIRAINYTSQPLGEDLVVKVIYNKGRETELSSPASHNVQESGYLSSQYFSQCSANSIIANIDNTQTLTPSSNITCGCGTYGENKLINSDFEDGLNNWTYEEASLIESNGNHYATILGSITQEVNISSSFSLDYLFSPDISNYIFVIGIDLNTSQSDPEIYYVSTDVQEFIDMLCSTDGLMIDTSYFKCFTPELGVWENASFNVKNDYESAFLEDYNFPNATITMAFMDIASGNISVDNIEFIETTQGFTCDSGNDGVLDGVCNGQSCEKLLFNSLSYPSLNFFQDTVFFNMSLNYLNPPNSCAITIEEETYNMEIEDNLAYYSGTFNEGHYSNPITVSCINSETFSYTKNASFDIVRFKPFEEMIGTAPDSRGFSVYSFSDNDSIILMQNSSSIYFSKSQNNNLNYSAPLQVYEKQNIGYNQRYYVKSTEDNLYFIYTNESLNLNYANISFFNYSYSTGESNFKIVSTLTVQTPGVDFVVDENNVHISTSNHDYIYYLNSSNGGVSFSEPMLLYNTHSVYQYNLNIQSSGNEVYIFFYNNTQIYLMNSSNGGADFSAPRLIYSNNSIYNIRKFYLSEYLGIFNIFLLIQTSEDDEYGIVHLNSSTSDLIFNNNFLFSLENYETSFTSDGNNLYLFFNEGLNYDLYLLKSTNNGQSFEDAKLIQNFGDQFYSDFASSAYNDNINILVQPYGGGNIFRTYYR